jgi:hypothetical protein
LHVLAHFGHVCCSEALGLGVAKHAKACGAGPPSLVWRRQPQRSQSVDNVGAADLG